MTRRAIYGLEEPFWGSEGGGPYRDPHAGRTEIRGTKSATRETFLNRHKRKQVIVMISVTDNNHDEEQGMRVK